MALAQNILKSSKLNCIIDFNNVSSTGCLKNLCFSISVRTAKHWNPKFKWLRTKKYIPIDLPHTEKSKEFRRNILKEAGVFPRFWKSRPLTVTSVNDIIDPYKPVVGDGKTSFLTKGMQSLTTPKSKMTDMTAIRKIKNYDNNFTKEIFLQEAQDIYIQAHKVLTEKDPDELSEFATDKSIMEMLANIKHRTIRWNFIESLEPPVIVQARAQEVLIKNNMFAQLTVRFHTKQTLAVYDRFGRLIFGNETLPKDVLEYVVFEKHICNEYGRWRLHAKIIPEWVDSTTSITRTYRVEDTVEEDEEDVILNERDPEADPDIEHQQTATSEIIVSDNKPSK